MYNLLYYWFFAIYAILKCIYEKRGSVGEVFVGALHIIPALATHSLLISERIDCSFSLKIKIEAHSPTISCMGTLPPYSLGRIFTSTLLCKSFKLEWICAEKKS